MSGIDLQAVWYNNLRNRIIHVLGVGATTYGYGQNIETAFTALPAKTNMEAVHMQRMKEHIQRARRHQVGNWTGYPSATLPDVIKGDEISVTIMNLYHAAVEEIENSRMNYGSSSLSVTGTRHTVTRGGMWGSDLRLQAVYGGWRWVNTGYPPSIITQVDANWSNFDRARNYFNSGGGLTINLQHPNTSGRANINWNRALSRIGPITLRALTTHGSPSRGVINPIGFHQLNNSNFTMIFNGTDIDDFYNYMPNYGFKDDVYIYAMLVARGVRLRIELHERNRQDYVSAGTRAMFSNTYATTYLTNAPISLPQYTTITNF